MSTDEVLDPDLGVIVEPSTESEESVEPDLAPELDRTVDPIDDPGVGPGRDPGRQGGPLGGEDGPVSRWQVVRHPITWYERGGRRFLPGLWFPVAVFVAWRLVHVVVVALLGGDVTGSPVAYDGVRYLAILEDGYTGWRRTMPNTAFFPMLPWVGRPLMALTGSEVWTVNSSMAITGLASFTTVFGATRTIRDEAVARRAVVLMALFPSSLFLWAFYSEGLFIALTAGAVWADRKGRHLVAALLLGPLAATRSVGIVVAAVLVVIRLARRRRVDRWALAYASTAAAGFATVLWTMWRWTGDPFVWMKVQEDWGRQMAPPWASVVEGYRNLWPDEDTIMVPALVARNWDLWCVGIVLVALVYAAISRRDRWPAEVWLLGAALVAVPLCSSALASFNRFSLAAWMVFPVYASMWGRLPGWARVLSAVVVVVAFGATTVLMVERFTASPYPRFVG